jgi:Phosphate transporter family
MTDVALDVRTGTGTGAPRPKLDRPLDPRTAIILLLVLAGGLLYVAYSLYADVDASGARPTTFLPYLLLFVALLIALGFEFVNGFHDTANAVATVIYTHSLPAQIAVMWSGSFNFLGVLLSSGAVAFGIISLLPVELILQVGSSAGFAMVFALLIAAIILEPRHLVSRPAGFELAHADRVDHRGRRRQRPSARPGWNLGCRLGAGHQCWEGAAVLPAGWLLRLGAVVARDESSHPATRTVSLAGD